MKKCIFNILVLVGVAAIACAQPSFTQFSTGYTAPLGIANAGDDRLFIIEQGGRIRIADTAGVKNASPFLNISAKILSSGEQGLLGLAFDPLYKSNGFFFVDYVGPTGSAPGETRISRFKVSSTNADSADVASEKILLRIRQPSTNHNGGNLMFGPDGYLYINMGDGGGSGDPQNRAQNPDSLLGKILRIDVADTLYKIPSDNPLVGKSGRDEIWALGVRNPWRASFDRWNGDMWIGEVGQDIYEEIDYQKAASKGGENYGWRCYEANHNFNTSGCSAIGNYTAPVLEIPHSTGAIAIVGGYRYRGAEFSDLFGKYFFTDESTSAYGFHYLVPNGTGGFTDNSLGTLGRSQIVSFGEDRWGELYVAEYANGNSNAGSIYKMKGQNCSPVAFLSDSVYEYVCDITKAFYLRTPDGRDFQYMWYANGLAIPGNNNDSLLVVAPGSYSVSVTNRNNCTTVSSTVVVVYPKPLSITGLDSLFCIYHPAQPLTGSPAGGSFTGTGVSNQIFYPDSAGTGYHSITYTYSNPVSGCTDSISMTVHIDACLNTDEQSFLSAFQLYPNPNKGEFTIKLFLQRSETLGLEVKDVLGRSVYKEQRHCSAGAQSIAVNTGLIAEGVYSIMLTNGSASRSMQFVVE